MISKGFQSQPQQNKRQEGAVELSNDLLNYLFITYLVTSYGSWVSSPERDGNFLVVRSKLGGRGCENESAPP